MASLTKRPTSKFWVACFITRDGRRLKKSTGTVDQRQAKRIADEYETAARKKRTAVQARRVIAQLHQEISGDDLSQKSVRNFLEGFLQDRAPEVKKATKDFYQAAAARFVQFLGPEADADLCEITQKHIINFRNEEAKRTAAKTTNHKLKFLKMVFKVARRDSLIADNPTEFVEAVKRVRGKIRRPFTIPELKAVISVADAEWRSMIMFGLYTGQRLGDIAELSWHNVDLEQGEIRLVTQKTYQTKILPMASSLRKSIEALPGSDDPGAPLHPRAFATLMEQGKTGSLSNQFAALLVQAGLRKKKAHRKAARMPEDGNDRRPRQAELSFHCLRHTSNTMMKEAGIPAAVVMELVGHDSEQMSEIYTHVGAEALQKAADSLPQLL